MRLAAWIAVGVLAGAVDVQALGTKQVRVSVEFRQSGKTEGTDIQGSGEVVITERRSGGAARLGLDSQTTRSSVRTGIFTVVQDGGDSMQTTTRL